MVFEQLFAATWVYKKQHAFILGFVYSLLGVVSARLIFPSNVGLMSIAFTSILLIPSLAELLRIETNEELEPGPFSFRRLWNDHSDIFQVYVFLFLGIFVAYSAAMLLMPEIRAEKLFTAQLQAAGIRGQAVFAGKLLSVLLNNALVFIVAFVLSLVYGAGAVLFLVWNASVWGVVFSFFIRHAATAAGEDQVVAFWREVVPFLPHMVTEGAAYIGAAIVGGIVSKAVLREDVGSERFNRVLKDALVFLVIGLVLVMLAGIIEIKWYAGR